MASLFMADSEFPQFREGQSTDEKLDEIHRYLYQLQLTLNYVLSNIGDANINENDIVKISSKIKKEIMSGKFNFSSENLYIDGIQFQNYIKNI